MSELSKTVAHDMMVRIIEQGDGESSSFPSEAELCARYGVSRVVIREAKKRLQALGMVQSRKKIGSVITPNINWNFFNQELFDIYLAHSGRAHEHMENYYSMRLLIEPHLAAQLARTHSPKFGSTMSELLCAMTKALDKGDDDAWLRSDLAYHITMYQESKNVLVLPLANLMRPLFLRGFSLVNAAAWAISLHTHRQLVDAMLAHDADQAFHYACLITRSGHEDYLAYQGQHSPNSSTNEH